MTDQTTPRDRLFALIASIPGSASVDWCDDARALVDEIATPSAPLPVSEARTRLLQALDAPYCQALGHTPEGLLTAYEASRTQTVDRAALSAKLWEIAERHIVAEWICCEPLEPGHDLCAKGYEALGMVKSLLVDADPGEAWNPSAPLLDVLAAVLPATTNHDTGGFELRGDTEIRAAALREAIALLDQRASSIDAFSSSDFGEEARAVRELTDVANELRRVADETAATETGCWCGHSEDRHWTGATDMTFTDGCHDCRGWNGAHVYGQELPWLPEGAEPAAGARQDGRQ